MDQVECVVVGAGVVGLAIARKLALQGLEVMVLEAADAIGTGTSSRNSEVIHAGLYYPTGSLKARLCVAGRQQLYAYAQERGVEHRRCGKLLVATSDEQREGLRSIYDRAPAMVSRTCNGWIEPRRRPWNPRWNASLPCFRPAPASSTATG